MLQYGHGYDVTISAKCTQAMDEVPTPSEFWKIFVNIYMRR